MSGETIRVERKERDYFSAQNEPFNDARLSFGARGLLAYILSKPNDWEVRNEDLIRQSPAGKAAVLGMLGELKKYGYMNRHRENRAGGYLEWVTVIYEIPSLNPDYQETPENDKPPKSDLPTVGKQDFGADRSPINRRSVKPKVGKSGDIVSTDLLLSTEKELSTKSSSNGALDIIEPVTEQPKPSNTDDDYGKLMTHLLEGKDKVSPLFDDFVSDLYDEIQPPDGETRYEWFKYAMVNSVESSGKVEWRYVKKIIENIQAAGSLAKHQDNGKPRRLGAPDGTRRQSKSVQKSDVTYVPVLPEAETPIDNALSVEEIRAMREQFIASQGAS